MTQDFVAATVLNIDDIKNQLRKASDTINVFRTNSESVPVRERVVKINSQAIGNHFVLDHPENGILDSSVLELDTGLGSLSTEVIKWHSNVVKEFFYHNDFIDSSLTTASVVSSIGGVSFSDGEELVSSNLTVALGSSPSATFLSPGNLSGTGSFSYYLSVKDSSYVTGSWELNNGVAIDTSVNGNDGAVTSTNVVEDCETTTAFSSVALASFSVNSTIYKYGSNAVNVYTSGTGENNLGFDIDFTPADVSEGVFTAYVYIKDSTVLSNVSSVVSYLHSDPDALGNPVPGWNKYSVLQSDLRVGWNIIRLDVDNPESIEGDGADSSNIGKCRFRIYKGTGVEFAEGDIVIDYLQYNGALKTYDVFDNEDGAIALISNRHYDTGLPGLVGADCNINIPTGPDLDVDYTNDFTYGVWFRTREDWVEYSGNNVGLMGYGFSVGIDINDGKLFAGFRDSAQQTIAGTTSIDDGEWHRAIVTYDSSTGIGYLYLDGVLENSDTVTQNFDTAGGDLNIGGKVTGNNTQNFNGDVCGAFLIKGDTWSQTEITNDYNSTDLTVLSQGGIWEEVTINDLHEFSNSGGNLRYKIVYSGSGGSLSVLNSNNSYNPVKISFTGDDSNLVVGSGSVVAPSGASFPWTFPITF